MSVDGLVLAAPTPNKEVIRRHAREATGVYKEFGALSVGECSGDDVPEGAINSMLTAVLRKDDEAVVFSWITRPDEATRNASMQRSWSIPGCRQTATRCPSTASARASGAPRP